MANRLAVKPFLEASVSLTKEAWALFGAPTDATASFRPGSRFAPAALREASEALESYCPKLDKDLADIPFADIGDIELPIGDIEASLRLIEETTEDILNFGAKPFLLGGEHTVTLPVVKALARRHEGLVVVQLDAHADLRSDYLGVKLSHACVMRRITEVIGENNIRQWGIRSGTKEEWAWMRSHGSQVGESEEALLKAVQSLADRPVYLTVDLDVLDPSCFPGTGTPEPGGASYRTLEIALHALCRLNLVGMDAVELLPMLDLSGISSVTAAKVVREMLLASF